ncbi:MAG: hypothetical protein ABIO40_04485 [Devosia sp.]
MRRLAILAALVFTVAPAAAQSIADQAERAYALFASGLSQPDFLLSGHGQKVLEGMTGKWARLTGPSPQTGVETYGVDHDKTCSGPAPVAISLPNPLTAQIVNTTPAGTFSQIYSFVAGATFAEHTDIEAYLTAVGLGPDKSGQAVDQQRATALSIVNGLVQFYRPSPDILVITRDRGYPLILARCPS